MLALSNVPLPQVKSYFEVQSTWKSLSEHVGGKKFPQESYECVHDNS